MLPDWFYEAALRLLAALGDEPVFPADLAGINRLMGDLGTEGRSEPAGVANQLPRAWGGPPLRVTAASMGSIRIQEPDDSGRSACAVLSPDGRLSDCHPSPLHQGRAGERLHGRSAHEHATELLLATACLMMARARFSGRFSVDSGELRNAISALRSGLAEEALVVADSAQASRASRGRYILWISESTPEAIRIRCRHGSQTVSGRVNIDGRFDARSSSVTVSADDPADLAWPSRDD